MQTHQIQLLLRSSEKEVQENKSGQIGRPGECGERFSNGHHRHPTAREASDHLHVHTCTTGSSTSRPSAIKSRLHHICFDSALPGLNERAGSMETKRSMLKVDS